MLRDALDEEAVARARRVADRHLVADDREAETEIPATELVAITELAELIFSSPVIGALQSLAGQPIAYYPNFVLRLNRFTDWHIDNGFLPGYHEQADHIYDPGFQHLQCAVYLQDNIPGVGGGLDAVSGSHRWAAEGIEPDHAILFGRYGDGTTIDSRAGDLIAFDGRLLHRGTPKAGPLSSPKYGLFWSVSRVDDRQVDRYLRYLNGRSDHLRSIGLGDEFLSYMLSRYDDVRSLRYPDSFPPDVVDVIEASGLTIATIDTP